MFKEIYERLINSDISPVEAYDLALLESVNADKK